MDMTDTRFAHPKPEPRQRTKRRVGRKASARVKDIRKQCIERDGYCRVGKDEGSYLDCAGPSQWAHFGKWKRAKTRGQAPDMRHTTSGSFMACAAHHQEYDSGELVIVAVDAERGCDGELTYARPSF